MICYWSIYILTNIYLLKYFLIIIIMFIFYHVLVHSLSDPIYNSSIRLNNKIIRGVKYVTRNEKNGCV